MPDSLDEFLKIKYNDPEKWKTLKRQYRFVNQYKIDSGNFSTDEILRFDKKVIYEKRLQFTSKYKKAEILPEHISMMMSIICITLTA